MLEQDEIKNDKFLKNKALNEYEISKSLEELEEFYSLNIHKLQIKHVPSRNPDKLVPCDYSSYV